MQRPSYEDDSHADYLVLWDQPDGQEHFRELKAFLCCLVLEPDLGDDTLQSLHSASFQVR